MTTYRHESSESELTLKAGGKFGGVFAVLAEDPCVNYREFVHMFESDADVCTSRDISDAFDDFDYGFTPEQQQSITNESLDCAFSDDYADDYVEMQKSRGEMARKLGFCIVEMEDETGHSFLLMADERISKCN